MGFGLLRDVDDFSNAQHYTTEHRLSTNLLEPGPFYQAAKFDAKKKKLNVDEYLSQVQNRLSTFFASDTVFGRDELKERVADAMESPSGGVTFLLGRRNLGKTKLLMEKVKEMNTAASAASAATSPSSVASTSDVSSTATATSSFVVYVNGRKTPSLAQGIKMALQNFDDKNMFENVPWEAMRLGLQGSNAEEGGSSADKRNGSSSSIGSSGGCSSFAQLFSSIQGKDEDAKLIELIVLLAAAKKKRPCLVVDEADICLPCGGSDSGNKTTLAMIYGLTQDQVMNIVLSSSDFDYPRNISKCSGILLSLTRTLYMEEFCPKSMWELLVEDTTAEGEPTVGMGNKLARFCISAVGGNPRTIQHALNVLRVRKEKFSAFGDLINYDIEGAANLEQYLDEKKRKTDGKSLMQILSCLGEQGYWEVEPGKSVVIDRLVADGVANSMLTSDLVECPLTEESFRVLVPSSQIIRHLILEQVNERNTGLMSNLRDIFSGKGK